MNSVVGSKLEVIFAEKGICGSCEQCMKPTQRNAYMETHCYPNPLKECAVSKEILSGTTRLAYEYGRFLLSTLCALEVWE